MPLGLRHSSREVFVLYITDGLDGLAKMDRIAPQPQGCKDPNRTKLQDKASIN